MTFSTDTHAPSVLIIDDEPGVCTSIELVLEEYLPIHTAYNVASGMQLLADIPGIVVVLLDIRLPDQDGISALKEIRRAYPHVKVIVVTAGRIDDVEETVLSLGADGYLSKPFEVDELRSAVLACT